MCLIPTRVLGNGTVGHRDFVQRNGEHHVAVFIESDAFVTCFTLIFPLKSVTGSLFSVPLHKGTVRSQDIANHLLPLYQSSGGYHTDGSARKPIPNGAPGEWHFAMPFHLP